jgi:hypothetical protein
MFIYTALEAIAGIVLAIVMVVRTKKKEEVVYNKLDKAGQITNIVLTAIYAFLAPIYLILGFLSYPSQEGFLGVIGGLIAVINASATLICSLSIGASVALRRKGKSKLSFAIQFFGFIAIILTISLYAIFVGDLLMSVN